MASHLFECLTKKRKANLPTMNRRKKSRLCQGNPDRLSDLPDSLIIQILCLLEMKDVVKTSVLSKRWKRICAQVDTIVLRLDFVPDIKSFAQTQKKLKRYTSSINNSLTQVFSCIRNFSFCGFDHFGYSLACPNLLKWIEYVLESNVEILKFDYKGFCNRTPPLSMFQCSSLTQLELSSCLITLSVPVNLPLLKSLSLNSVHLTQLHLEDILVGCPLLEALVLIDVTTGFNHICIISTSMKKLKIVGIQYSGPGHNVDLILEIRVSSLQELEISGGCMFRQCVTGDFSSLVKANLMFTIYPPIFVDDEGFVLDYLEGIAMMKMFNNDWIRMVEGLLKSLCHVGELLIGSDILQVMSVTISPQLRNPLLTFMCKHVTIVSPLWKYDLPGIVYLLEASPHLETLVVDVSTSEFNHPIDQAKEALSVAKLHLIRYANGNLLHLKNVKICYQRNPCGDCPLNNFQIERKCLDFELVDYILRRCVSLERILLCSSRACINDKCLKPYCAFKHVNQLSSKLLTHSLPRKEDAEWEVKIKKIKFALEYTFSN